jgi:hypothetical protein
MIDQKRKTKEHKPKDEIYFNYPSVENACVGLTEPKSKV